MEPNQSRMVIQSPISIGEPAEPMARIFHNQGIVCQEAISIWWFIRAFRACKKMGLPPKLWNNPSVTLVVNRFPVMTFGFRRDHPSMVEFFCDSQAFVVVNDLSVSWPLLTRYKSQSFMAWTLPNHRWNKVSWLLLTNYHELWRNHPFAAKPSKQRWLQNPRCVINGELEIALTIKISVFLRSSTSHSCLKVKYSLPWLLVFSTNSHYYF